jgi:MFS family permease
VKVLGRAHLGTADASGMMGGMRPAVAAIIVFLAAAAVLVLEILAARLMAPYVGVSLNTYTGIIGTVLAGIAAGAWVGGRLADRFEPRLLLGPILVLGGLFALATPPLVTKLGEHVNGASMAAVIVLSGATVFMPAFVLSSVTPIVVKMQLQDLSATGRVVGRMSAFATAGALVGTYGTGFVLAARFPNKTIIAFIGGLLIVLGLTVWWRLTRRVSAAATVGVVIATLATGAAVAAVDGPCKVESGYFCIRVSSGGPGDSVRLLRLDDLVHGSVYLPDPSALGLDYSRVVAAGIDVLAPAGKPIKALTLGGGSFSLPRHIAAVYPDSTNTVLELDQAVVDTAREDLGLRDEPGLRVEVGDARLLVKDEPARTYDFAIGDAFASRSVPWHLTTREFLGQLKGVMRPRGTYLMNLIDPELRFVRAEAATLKHVFRHVALLRSLTTSNNILVASNAPIDAEAIAAEARRRKAYAEAVTGRALDRLIDDAEILEDDFAPVDQLLH